jgi:hypothetical protein
MKVVEDDVGQISQLISFRRVLDFVRFFLVDRMAVVHVSTFFFCVFCIVVLLLSSIFRDLNVLKEEESCAQLMMLALTTASGVLVAWLVDALLEFPGVRRDILWTSGYYNRCINKIIALR